MGKWSSEIEQWYQFHIDWYAGREDIAIKSLLSGQASNAVNQVYNLLGDNDLEQAIMIIEQSIKQLADISVSGVDAGKSVASALINANTKFNNVIDTTTLTTLEKLADGTIGLNEISFDDLEGQISISPNEIGSWIQKILIGLQDIQMTDKSTPTKLQGYVSNLKGALLEEGVLRLLANSIPKDAVVRSGNIGVSGRGQIAEDILLIYPNGRQEPLLSMLNKAQNERITIDIPTYELLQESAAGVSIKAGGKSIKYFQGNITHFFDDSITDEATAYKAYLLNRREMRQQDKKVKIKAYPNGNELNRLLVSAKLKTAIGENNLFIVIRGKFLRTSVLLQHKKESARAQLRMNDVAGTMDSVTGRIVGSGA